MAVFEGGCLCGKVRYRAESMPSDQVSCHCRLCQRSAGAPYLAWLTFSVACFSYTAAEPRVYASSPVAQREFCADCGTQLVFRHTACPTELDVTTVSLDEPNFPELAPREHIWTDSKITWVELGDLPCHRQRRT